MSSLKVTNTVIKKERSMLNTTIDAETFEQFKNACKASGIQMNTLIECFMRQYVEGCFVLTIGDGTKRKRSVNINFKN